jgi:hypothetical protein
MSILYLVIQFLLLVLNLSVEQFPASANSLKDLLLLMMQVLMILRDSRFIWDISHHLLLFKAYFTSPKVAKITTFLFINIQLRKKT